MIDKGTIEGILEATDLLALIGEFTTVRGLKACCPFHDDRRPSLVIYPAKRKWRCYPCGRGGNALDFLRTVTGMRFHDALRDLADRAGLPLETVRGWDRVAARQKLEEKAKTKERRRRELTECNHAIRLTRRRIYKLQEAMAYPGFYVEAVEREFGLRLARMSDLELTRVGLDPDAA